MHPQRAYKRHRQTAGRVIDGQAFIVTADDNKLHRLNPQATLLWEMSASEGLTAEAAAEALCREFEVDLETAVKDSQHCLEDFVQRRLFELVPDAAANTRH